MPERQYRALSKRIVDRLAVEGKDAVFWDRELPGFGVRVYPSGRKVYVVQTRAGGKSRQVTVGHHGDIAPDRAHKEAARVIARIKAGLPPVETEPEAPPTVVDLAGRYRREYVAMHCKPNTVKHYGLMLKKHIVPRLGEIRVSEVERKDILKLQFQLSDMPTVANRCVDILVKMFNLAEQWEMRPPGRNPCKSVRRYKGDPASGADRVPAQRDHGDRMGRSGLRGGRDAPEGQQNRHPHRSSAACGRRRAEGFAARPGQSLGVSRQEEGRPSGQHQRLLGPRPPARRSRRPRSPRASARTSWRSNAMARLDSATISRRTVEALPVGDREAVYWDSELQGFGVRVYPSGSKIYLVQTRAAGKSRRSPRWPSATCASMWRCAASPPRSDTAGTPSTATSCRRWAGCPSGRSGASGLRRCNTACTRRRRWRTRSSTCSRGFSIWPRRGASRPRAAYPCRFVKKYKERNCERFLSEEEFRRLGRVLAGLPRPPDNPWMIAGMKPGARLSNLNNAWLVPRPGARREPAGGSGTRERFFTLRAMTDSE